MFSIAFLGDVEFMARNGSAKYREPSQNNLAQSVALVSGCCFLDAPTWYNSPIFATFFAAECCLDVRGRGGGPKCYVI